MSVTNRYKVFIIDGDFFEEDAPFVRFDGVNGDELKELLELAMKQDFDVVIRLDIERPEG